VQTHLAQDWHTLAAAAPQGAPPHAYICGLQRMVGAVRDLLRKDLGAERQQVHSERYD
jgi:ferredoxin-NADP reductase